VKKQLVAIGIDVGRLSSEDFGASNPVGENTTPAGQANNRRVKFVKTS